MVKVSRIKAGGGKAVEVKGGNYIKATILIIWLGSWLSQHIMSRKSINVVSFHTHRFVRFLDSSSGVYQSADLPQMQCFEESED